VFDSEEKETQREFINENMNHIESEENEV